MSEEEQIKYIVEILELAKGEIENNNENITATLDLQDLKSLKNLYDLYQAEKEKNKKIEETVKKGMKNLWIDTCAEDAGKYSAYMSIREILEE